MWQSSACINRARALPVIKPDGSASAMNQVQLIARIATSSGLRHCMPTPSGHCAIHDSI
jgi:hypothetical protein